MILWILLSCLILITCDNPLAQTVYTADPAPYPYKDKMYLYTGHDADKASYFDMPDWQAFSTEDMQNWENHGTVLSAKDFSWAEPGSAWAAQVVERNGKFYYYVTLSKNGRAIGVAVGDSPIGPFKDALGKPLCGPNWDFIDPTVFIDSDGQAYLYFGNPQLYYVKLNEDMISYSGDIKKVDMTTDAFGTRNGGDDRHHTLYEEGPWFYKRGDLYYMVYAASGIPENICYSTSSSPTGPWKHRGVIMPNGQQGAAFTNHPGVADFEGHSYFFYHNQRLPGGGGFDRSVAVEEFTYGDDGSFPSIKMSNDGPKQLKPFDPFRKVPATTICFESGVEIEKGDNGGVHVSNIQNGSYIKIKGVDFKNGAKKFSASVSSDTQGGKIELHLDKKDGTSVGSCSVGGTGGWQKFETVECDVDGASSQHDLFLVFTGGSGFLFNLDWWQFE